MEVFLFHISLQEWFMMKICWMQKYQLIGYAINFLSIETEMSEFIKMLYLVFAEQYRGICVRYVYVCVHYFSQ